MTTLSSVANVTTIVPRFLPLAAEKHDTRKLEDQAQAEGHQNTEFRTVSLTRNGPQAREARKALQLLLGQMKQLPQSQLQWPAKAIVEGALRMAEKQEAVHQADSTGLQTARRAVADALLNPLGNTTVNEVLEKATDFLAFTALRDGEVPGTEPQRSGPPLVLKEDVHDAGYNRAKIDLFNQQLQNALLNDLAEREADSRSKANGLRQFMRERLESETKGNDSREQTLSRMMNTFNDPAPNKSDKEIYNDIIKLITEMQNAFMQPFIGAAEKMRIYYDTLSKLRDVIAKNVKAEDDKNVKITRSEIFKAIEEMINQFSGEAGVLHQADSEEEARSMREKFGSGVVTQDPKSGKWVVKIDITQLNDMNKTARDTLTDDKTSLTAYNNFLSAVDAFLTREQNKTSKITNQLEYYNKLINNVQDTITQFFKQMCELAVNFLRI